MSLVREHADEALDPPTGVSREPPAPYSLERPAPEV
jgi:hypothetical protein